jgi:hypothetical protein
VDPERLFAVSDAGKHRIFSSRVFLIVAGVFIVVTVAFVISRAVSNETTKTIMASKQLEEMYGQVRLLPHSTIQRRLSSQKLGYILLGGIYRSHNSRSIAKTHFRNELENLGWTFCERKRIFYAQDDAKYYRNGPYVAVVETYPNDVDLYAFNMMWGNRSCD